MPNSATLVQALGAAFCAILCALSGMGGGGMMIGARTAAWAKSGYTAKDYVQNGLVAMWDGIENAGFAADGYQHDPNATVWKDLIGSRHMTKGQRDYVWHGNCLEITGSQSSSCFELSEDIPYFDAMTMEVVFRYDDFRSSRNPGIVNFGPTYYYNGYDMNQRVAFCRADVGKFACKSVASNRQNIHAAKISIGGIYSFSQIFDGLNQTNGGYLNGVPQTTENLMQGKVVSRKGVGIDNCSARVYCVRSYNRNLSVSEIAANYAVDKARFGLT